MMKKTILTIMAFAGVWSACAATGFVKVKGHGLVDEKGEAYFIRGVNLGNWLNPEGYMFGFSKCNSAHMIDEMFKELVGPEQTRRFWKAFKDNYITEADLAFVAATGHNPSNDWYRQIRESMERNGIGWTVWPLKKPGSSSWFNFPYPEGWKETIVAFAESDRSSYAAIQKNRPDRATALRLMNEFVENCKAEHCTPDVGYLEAFGLRSAK